MLRLSKKTDYALMAMKHLALQSAASGGAGAASAREIAEHYDIPIELLAKILQRLARRGLLTSHQGTRGGYSLARPATVISVADVIQAVDGPLTVTACSVHDQACGQYLEVQRPRSAVAHQGSDPDVARRLQPRRDRDGRAGDQRRP